MVNDINFLLYMPHIDLHWIIAALLGLYELIVRLVPTIGNYAITNYIVKFLSWLNDTLNNKKK